MLKTIGIFIACLVTIVCNEYCCALGKESLTELEIKQAQETAIFLSDYFAYTREEINNQSASKSEKEADALSGQMTFLLERLKESKKRKIVGFIADGIPLEVKDPKLKAKLDAFEDNFIRVFTLGNGLCAFHALGVQKTETASGESVIGERTFPYFEIVDKQSRLFNACTSYMDKISMVEPIMTDYNEYSKLKMNLINSLKEAKKAGGTVPAQTKEMKVIDIQNFFSVFEAVYNFFQREKKNIDVLISSRNFPFGKIPPTDLETKHNMQEIEKVFGELKAHCCHINKETLLWLATDCLKYIMENDRRTVGYMTLMLRKLIDDLSEDKMLTSAPVHWPSFATTIPAHIDFSRALHKKVALFYRETDDDSNVFSLCNWTILDKDPEDADRVYDRIAYDGKVKFEKLVFAPASEEDLCSATDYILYEANHFSRVIPRKLWKMIKENLPSDIAVCEMNNETSFAD